jgi:hypothetical protein
MAIAKKGVPGRFPRPVMPHGVIAIGDNMSA